MWSHAVTYLASVVDHLGLIRIHFSTTATVYCVSEKKTSLPVSVARLKGSIKEWYWIRISLWLAGTTIQRIKVGERATWMSRSVPCIFFWTQIARIAWISPPPPLPCFLCLFVTAMFRLSLSVLTVVGKTWRNFVTIFFHNFTLYGRHVTATNSNFVWIVDFVAWVSSLSELTPKFFLHFEIKIFNCSISFAVTQGIFPFSVTKWVTKCMKVNYRHSRNITL